MTRKKYLEIAEHLELQILSGALKPGDRLPAERELMEQFNAGRSSVREALFSLQRQGLLTANSGAVPRVSRPTADKIFAELSGTVRHFLTQPEGLRQMQDARALFEIGIARRAAQIATDQDVATIARIHEKSKTAETLESFAETDVAFHLAIANASGNPIFNGLNNALAAWLKDQRTRSAAAGATFDGVIEQHGRILVAIRCHEPDLAAQAMQDHLESVARLYWEGFMEL